MLLHHLPPPPPNSCWSNSTAIICFRQSALPSQFVLSRNRARLEGGGVRVGRGGVRVGRGGGRVCFMRATDALLQEKKAKQA